MSGCESCGGAADAVVYYTDPDEAVDYCRRCALEQQMRGTHPVAVVWKSSVVDIEINP